MKVLRLGKVLSNPNQNPMVGKKHEIKLNKNGNVISIVSKDPLDRYGIAKTIIEDFYLSGDNIVIIDNNGYLSSIGLVFDPDNIDEIALLIPYEKNELPELKAMEFSAKFKELLDNFNEFDHFNQFRNEIHFNIFYEGLKGHRRIYNTPFILDFSKSKDFAQEFLEYYATFINETYNLNLIKDDINLIKYVAAIAIKNNLNFNNLTELFQFFDSLPKYSDKLNVTAEKLTHFIKKVKNKFTKFRDYYFDGLNFSEELLLKISEVKNITSIYIDSENIQYKQLETLIFLKKILNTVLSGYSKELLIVIDLEGLSDFYKTLLDNISLFKAMPNLNLMLIGDNASVKTIPKYAEVADYFYYKQIDHLEDKFPPIRNENIYLQKSKNDEIYIFKRPEFSITKKIGAADISKLKINDDFLKLLGKTNNKDDKTKIYKLIIQDGPLAGKEILLTADEIIFGRNEFFPSNKLISRRHFKLEFDGENYFIIDTSVNGTFINKQKIGKSVLADGDIITLGNNEVNILFKIE